MRSDSARHVYLMRHLPQIQARPDAGWAPNAPLAPEAVAMAEKLNATRLNGVKFDYYGASTLRRARDSIELLRPGAPVGFYEELGPGRLGDWDEVLRLGLKTPAEIYAHTPKLLRACGDGLMSHVFRVGLNRLADGQNALLVSHSPLVESAISTCVKVWPPEYTFKHGDIARFSVTPAKERVHFEYLPFPG